MENKDKELKWQNLFQAFLSHVDGIPCKILNLQKSYHISAPINHHQYVDENPNVIMSPSTFYSTREFNTIPDQELKYFSKPSTTITNENPFFYRILGSKILQ